MVFAICRPLLRPMLERRRRCGLLVVLVTSTLLFVVNVSMVRRTNVILARSASPTPTRHPVSGCPWITGNSGSSNSSASPLPWKHQTLELNKTTSTTPVQTGGRRMYVNLPASSARLGNQMFAHAAMLGVAYCTGFWPVTSLAGPTNGHVLQTFSMNSTPVVKDELHAATRWHAAKTSVFTPPESMVQIVDSTQPSSNDDVELVGYFQSWKYFAAVSDQVLADFQFKPWIAEAASAFIEGILAKHGDKQRESYILVGIHSRRGDMASPNQISRGYRAADENYFVRAMEFVEKRILDKKPSARIIYVVCSDEPSWSQANIASKRFPVHHTNNNDVGSAGVDLATLASCDHVIISTGTFSWWAGYLANARRETDDCMVIYYGRFPPLETEIGSGFLASDYYPPSWIGMT